MKIIKAPNEVNFDKPALFLSGSIEMGDATKWQDMVVVMIAQWDEVNKRNGGKEWIGQILNPRRDDWDRTWEQSIENPQFKEQVEWELEGLENSDYVYMHFDPNTKSPITLMELGMMKDKKKLIVNCGEEFWRQGNVEVFCSYYGIPLFHSIEESIEQLCRSYLNMRI